MITTCTLNPAIDYHLYHDQFEKGKLNRATQYHFDLGGKGINVSKTLNQLACRSRSITFLNPALKPFYKKTFNNSPYIKFDIVKTEALTRFNVKLHDESETEINTSLESVKSLEIYKLTKKIKKVKSHDILIFSGSSIKSEPYIYDCLISSLKYPDISLIIDIPTELYNQVLKYKPLLVKPNKTELKTYFDLEEDPDDFVPYCKKLIELGAQNVVLSLGRKGSVLVTKNEVHRIALDEIKTNQTIGAGDALVAGFAYYYQKTKDVVASYKFAHATSYAYLIHPNFELIDVERIFKKIQMKG